LLDLASSDSTSALGAALVPTADGLTLGLRPESIVPVFIADGSEAVKKEVVDHYRPEPAIPFTNAVALTENGFGRVAKYYVHTTQDRAVGLALQPPQQPLPLPVHARGGNPPAAGNCPGKPPCPRQITDAVGWLFSHATCPAHSPNR
jgi:hypothetical protein